MRVFRRALCCVGDVEFLQVHESIGRDLFSPHSDTRKQHLGKIFLEVNMI